MPVRGLETSVGQQGEIDEAAIALLYLTSREENFQSKALQKSRDRPCLLGNDLIFSDLRVRETVTRG